MVDQLDFSRDPYTIFVRHKEDNAEEKVLLNIRNVHFLMDIREMLPIKCFNR